MQQLTLVLATAIAQLPVQVQEPLTLASALELALANRPAIQAAHARLASARAARTALGAYPSTRLEVGYTPDLDTGGADDDLVLVQPIDLFGRTAAGRSAGSALVLQAQAELLQTRTEVQFEVIEAFSDAAAASELSGIGKQTQDIAQRLHDAIRTLVDEGHLPGVQLTRVAIELERARIDSSQRDADQQASMRRLEAALYMHVGSVAISSVSELPVVSVDPGSLPSRRADLMLLAAEIAGGEAEARTARLSLLPELEIQGRRTPWEESETKYGARVQLSMPLFDHGKARSETKAANQRVVAGRRSLADATRLAEAELAAAEIELRVATEQSKSYDGIVASTRSLVEKSQLGFTAGAVNLIELLEATRTLREVEDGAIEARLRLVKARAALLKASGQILEARP